MSLASLLKKGSLRGFATATPATVATDKLLIPSSVATVATVNVANSQNPATNDPVTRVQAAPAESTPAATDPDRWAWPHSAAMSGAEIDTFAARLSRFTGKGIQPDTAEALADKLLLRDREADERRTCAECTHLTGHGARLWRCTNSSQAGVALRAADAMLPGDLVSMIQRCSGFGA